MAEHSTIEWTDATWNPITGCSVISPGCTNCYAMKLAGGRLQHHPSRAGLTVDSKAGPVWTGELRFNEDWLDQPLRWTKPRHIFVCAHGDLFHEGVPDTWIDRVFAVMALAPQHTFQVLTKRASRMCAYMTGRPQVRWIEPMRQLRPHPSGGVLLKTTNGSLPNVWLGVSAEDHQRAAERVPTLLQTPAAVRFLSAEPLLGPIDLRDLCNGHAFFDALAGKWWHDVPEDHAPAGGEIARLDQVIAGGENGPRPMHPDWVRKLRDDCADTSTAFFFKQWGSFAVTYDRDIEDPDWQRCGHAERETPNGRWLNLAGGEGFHGNRPVRVDRVGKTAAGRILDGQTHDQMPEPRT